VLAAGGPVKGVSGLPQDGAAECGGGHMQRVRRGFRPGLVHRHPAVVSGHPTIARIMSVSFLNMTSLGDLKAINL
jgi:hypothetical protein